MVHTKKLLLAKRCEGLPKITDFYLETETLPALGDGDVLAEAIFFSIDAGLRAYSARVPIGATMICGQVAKIVESKNENFPVGAHVYGVFGWRTHTIFNPKDTDGHLIKPYVLPDFGNLPLSLAVGYLGMPGVTAYYGLLDICQPKAGEVVVVSGAAGGVGTLVGQIAKIKGCKVIGTAGCDTKCDRIKKLFGFDHTINYKTESVSEQLKKYAPDGVDCYFDNVGGELSSIVIRQMREFGRISVCGSVSSYNLSIAEWPKVPILQPTFISKQLKMEGFIVTRWWDKWFDGIAQIKEWIDEGKIQYRETITNGFESAPQALIDVLEGRNFGKAIVKV